jgi:hypothetical protein
MPDNSPKVTLENVRLIYRNFSGREGRFNKEGERQFCAILPEELAGKMLQDGWNIKRLKPRDQDEDADDAENAVEGEPYLPIKVGYKFRAPRITQITSTNRTPITEDMVGSLDWVDVLNCDLVARGRDWDNPVAGGPTITAWLQTMYITIDEDELDRKYAISDGDR